MKKSLLKITLISVFAFAFTLAGNLMAQEQEKAEHAGDASKQSITVTGCLQKGDEAGEYSITEDGKTYGLRSDSVDLSKHVGHKVSITGKMSAENEADDKAEASEKNEGKGAKEAGDIRVSDLKMVSDSCQQ